ncbi:MAG: tRNA adenosine(34) deaminase TadA [Oscillospiraceae bacterium]
MTHRDYMEKALELAQLAYNEGEVPVGAIIVKDGEIIGSGSNKRQTGKNALAHAEIIAIDSACKTLGSWRLESCTLYVTLEPCAMCAGAIINSRIKTVVFSAVDPKAGALGGLCDLSLLPFNHKPEIIIGVMEQESRQLLQSFFKQLREKKDSERYGSKQD